MFEGRAQVPSADLLQTSSSLATHRAKRARTTPARFEDMIAMPRGGTMRVRTLEECLLQVAFFAADGDEDYADCRSVFLPLFDGDTTAHDLADEVGLSLQLSQAHLRKRMFHSALLEVQLLQVKLTECIRAQYKHLVYRELQDERGRILCYQKNTAAAREGDPAACHSQHADIMLNVDEHVRMLSLLMAEEKVAEQQHDFMCPLSRGLMICPVITSCGTVYDRKR